VFQGELEHRDSSGSHGKIGPGDVQWMTAASGVVHEEYHSARFARDGGMFEVAQLWVNLPAAEKKTPPRYQELRSAKIPTARMNGAAIRVIAGEFASTKGPAHTVTPIHLWDIRLDSNANFELPVPAEYTTMLLVRNGEVRLNAETDVAAVSLVIFERDGDRIALSSTNPAAAILLAGEPIGEPVVGQGPFVMNTREEIREAYGEYQSGAMGRLQ
jgi:quercetin 2,3-dioxygenase